MKTRISLFFALAAMICVPSAFGQYVQQPNRPVAPVVSPQNWAASPAARNIQQPVTQNTTWNNQDQNAATASVGCDSYCGPRGCDSGCGTGCDSGCDAGCGIGGGLGGRCGEYNPCCPTRYFSVFGGGVYYNDLNIDLTLTDPFGDLPAEIQTGLSMNDGWGFGGAVGRSIGRKCRGEFEFCYRNANVNGVAVNGDPILGLDGYLNQYSFMPNLLFDLNPNGRINLYAGVGAGVVFNDLQFGVPQAVEGRIRDSQFCYQGILGISTCLSQRCDLFVEYRYFGTDQVQLDAVVDGLGELGARSDVTSNNVFVGMRVKRW